MLAPPIPISETFQVQPIIVCPGTGTVSAVATVGCASTVATLDSYETMTQAIYDQAGIGIAFANAEYFDDTAYLYPNVDSSATGLYDTAHNLLDLPGHGQAAGSQTLNVFLVDNLTTSNGKVQTPNVYAYGFGLINGNGAILAAKPNSIGRQAALDTMAHELGHNLGLQHVDAPPLAGTEYDTKFNLMNSGSRVVPFETCQVRPYSCAPLSDAPTHAASADGSATLSFTSTSGVLAGMVATGAGIPANDTVLSVSATTVTLSAPTGGVASGATIGFALPETDQLAPFQIATIKAPPVFTELPNVVSATVPEAPGLGQSVQIVASIPTALTEIQWRFTDPSTTTYCAEFEPGFPTCDLGSTTGTESKSTVGTHVEWTVKLSPPLSYAVVPPTVVEGFCIPGDPACSISAEPDAYSTAFTFGNGTTSRAGFDSTGTSYSQSGAVFTFDPDDQPTGPSIIPTGPISAKVQGVCLPDAICEDSETVWSTPDEVAGVQGPFAALDGGPAPVPEPSGLLLLLTAFGGLAAMRRRRGRGTAILPSAP